jgi:hypothetical protein
VNNRRLRAEGRRSVVVDSVAEAVRVEWDSGRPLRHWGNFRSSSTSLKTAGLFEAFVAAPQTRDVLGTAMLSMLTGHKRHSHIAALRGDGVLPELLWT